MPQQTEISCLIGIAPWKRKRILQLLANHCRPRVARTTKRALAIAKRNGGAVAGWASRLPHDLHERSAAAGVDIWTIEDGFIRSVGLGASLTQPSSIVIDRSGIHYDSRRTSDLEDLLQKRQFSEGELERANALIEMIRRHDITKYNLGGKAVEFPIGRRVVLVLGQVDDDMSVHLGGAGQTVSGMLARVRADEPDAFLVFKPHPDVATGLRRGLMEPNADLIVTDARLSELFDVADSVHVLTSLAGFEALLRDCEVVVHGQPFYAGWGLTQDLAPISRRTRDLSLSELVACALIEYPLYCDAVTGEPCEVEDLVNQIAGTRPPQKPNGLRMWLSKAAGRLGEMPLKWKERQHAK